VKTAAYLCGSFSYPAHSGKGLSMKASTLLKISAAAGIAAIGAAVYKSIGLPSSVALTGAGYAGVLAKDDKPVAAFASTGMRPHSFAGFTARTCGWICAASATEAIHKKMKAAKRE
jgi:hypothetical protein